MSKFKSQELLQDLQDDVKKIIEAAEHIRQAEPMKLSYQPGKDRWSISQILEHLNAYNRHYLPLIEKAIAFTSKQVPAWFISGYWGEWLEIDRYALALTRQLQDELKAHYDAYEFHFVVQKLQTFCSEDLGGFYLDILKDRLYTSGTDSHARRAAQNALHHLTHALARWMAPIVSFTGEEVWTQLAGENDSVFLHTWHELPVPANEADLLGRWTRIRALRAEVQKELEIVRVAGGIGSSLQAEVTLHASPDTRALLAPLADDLRFVLITSQARVVSADADRVEVAPSAAHKCDRCWHYRDDVDAHPDHPGLCGRCVSNLYGEGEARAHA